MLWVYGRYKYGISFSAGIVFRRQILTFKDDPRTERVKELITETLEGGMCFNPLSPHDALKYHFTSLKTDLIFQ